MQESKGPFSCLQPFSDSSKPWDREKCRCFPSVCCFFPGGISALPPRVTELEQSASIFSPCHSSDVPEAAQGKNGVLLHVLKSLLSPLASTWPPHPWKLLFLCFLLASANKTTISGSSQAFWGQQSAKTPRSGSLLALSFDLNTGRIKDPGCRS